MSLLVHVRHPAGIITLNRPDKRNALSRQLLADIAQAFDDLHQERKVRAVILTGAGTAFCAGMDLAEMQETARQPDALLRWHEDAVQYRELLDKMLLFPKPIIAAVNGPAVAGGAGLVVASDIVIASGTAKFGLPEPRRGIVAGLVSPLLVFKIGGSHAANLLLTGRMIEAAEAQRIGLYHELAAEGQLAARAEAIAAEIAASAAEAIQLTKKMLYETIGEHLGTQLSSGAAASATARTTEAAREGLAAFLEKREPEWP
ncbi:MAG: enoyl-CoA hydratase/isomerase family protein [Pirellulaceae bacterium]|nr:enoyl-CoA hydratase/isomerase family protein [Pirellulaceae bacterium]